MEVSFISFSEKKGGAALAAKRIQSAVTNCGLKTCFHSIDSEGYRNNTTIFERFIDTILWICTHLATKIQLTRNSSKHSLNLFGKRYFRNIIKESELLHINWINNEIIKISDFHLFSGKSIITLHDEWFYCGSEHCAIEISENSDRYICGYSKKNKDVSLVDINRIIWNLKKKHYKKMKEVIFTVPSSWMHKRASSSYLLKDMDIRLIPNPIDGNIFRRKNPIKLKKEYGFSEEDFVIIFGAVGGKASYLKGYDLLIGALKLLSEDEKNRRIKLLVFGGKISNEKKLFKYDLVEVGYIESESDLANIYSLGNLTIVPSRVESFGQVAAESLSCETPVVAFNNSGIVDIIDHKKTGYLAEAFSVQSLSDGVKWFYDLKLSTRVEMGILGRKEIQKKFGIENVGMKFVLLYKELMNIND